MKNIFLKNSNQKKKIKIGVYNPFIDTLGGGEKHILSIIFTLAKILEQKNKNNVEVNIFWNEDLTKKIKDRFLFQNFKPLNWLPINYLSSSLKTLQILKTFNYFFYVTDGSYFFSSAKKNFVFSMIPDKKLYQLSLINRLKLWNYQFISNSPYTTHWLTKWGIKPITISPYIDDIFFENKRIKKQKIILSVGRFFPHLHSKNQEKIIKTFLKLKKQSALFSDYQLIIGGGLKDEDKKYFNKLKLLAKDTSQIIFKPNLPFNELYHFYQKANYFWHFTGLGIDENKNPEKVEHFGITPLEAIASQCLVFCHNSGGPKIIIKNNQTGILFNNENDLIEKMIKIEKDQKLKEKIISQGQKMVKNNFSYQKFQEKVLNNLIGSDP